MTTITTRPDAQISQAGTVLVGAGSRLLAVTDNDDASYVEFDNLDDSLVLEAAEPTIPAGGVVIGYAVRLRCKKQTNDGKGRMQVSLSPDWNADPTTYVATLDLTWQTITTVTALFQYPSRHDPDDLLVTLVRTLGSNGRDVRIHEIYVDTIYAAKPTVDVTAPTGTVTQVTQPTVEWTPTLDADGGAQTFAWIRVFSAAQYGAGGFNPTTSPATLEKIYSGSAASGKRSHTFTETLPDDSYRAYVMVGQEVPYEGFSVSGETHNHDSDWAYEAFTIDVDRPAVLSFTATPQPTGGRVKLVVETDPAGDVSADYVEFQRSIDGGTTWEDVRATDDGREPVVGDEATAFDSEVGNGVDADYRARAIHVFSEGFESASEWETASATWESSECWLKSPTRPDLNTVVTFISQRTLTRQARQGRHQPLGRDTAVVVSDTRAAYSGPLTLEAQTEAQQAAIDALLDLGEALLLQGRPDDFWTDRYLRFGDGEWERSPDKGFIEAKNLNTDWVEVDPPSGDVVSWPSDPPEVAETEDLMLI